MFGSLTAHLAEPVVEAPKQWDGRIEVPGIDQLEELRRSVRPPFAMYCELDGAFCRCTVHLHWGWTRSNLHRVGGVTRC
jgi:hypothetical protein